MAAAWEQFVRISTRMPAPHRALLMEALDKIIAAPNGEGVALLRAVRARNNGQLLTITGENYGSSLEVNGGDHPTGYRINMDIEAVANLSFTDHDTRRPASVMGLLVHELYHAADDRSYIVETTLARLALIEKEEPSRFSPTMRAAMRGEATQALADIRRNQFFTADPGAPYDADKYPHLANFSAYLLQEDNRGALSHHTQELRRIGSIVHGADKLEDDATRFTDAFMQRSGCNEPWRGEYYNSHRDVDRTAAEATNPICSGSAPTQGFTAQHLAGFEQLGELTSPRVQPFQPERAPQRNRP